MRKKHDFFSKENYNFSINDVALSKDVLNNKVEKITNKTDFLKVCRNQTLILGSLEYMRVVMEIEDVELGYKKDLLDFISIYISKLELILDDINNFVSMDLSLFEKMFDQFQDYVSIELKIIPRVDDEDFSYSDYY